MLPVCMREDIDSEHYDLLGEVAIIVTRSQGVYTSDLKICAKGSSKVYLLGGNRFG